MTKKKDKIIEDFNNRTETEIRDLEVVIDSLIEAREKLNEAFWRFRLSHKGWDAGKIEDIQCQISNLILRSLHERQHLQVMENGKEPKRARATNHLRDDGMVENIPAATAGE